MVSALHVQDTRADAGRLPLPLQSNVPSTELITPMHGLALVWFGLRTRSLGRGGSLGEDAALASDCGVFLPATMLAANLGVDGREAEYAGSPRESGDSEVVDGNARLPHWPWPCPRPHPFPRPSSPDLVRRISGSCSHASGRCVYMLSPNTRAFNATHATADEPISTFMY